MSEIKVNTIVDASGGNTVAINGLTPTESNMAGRNRLINSDMRIDQRNAGASIASGFPVDRWSIGASQASKFTAQQNGGGVTPPAGFTNYLGMTSSSAYSVTSTDYFFVFQGVEGLNTSDLAWGSASASSVTLSFRVYSSLTGTFGGAIKNGSANRSYPFSFTVSSANTWTTISITIPGDTSGTWATDNSAWGYVAFGLGSGSTRLGTANAWAGANYDAPTGSVSVVGTNGATFYITGVQLEAGSVATPFERRLYGQELVLCQRYCHVWSSEGTSYRFIGIGFTGTNSAQVQYRFPVIMRANPTVTFSEQNKFIIDGNFGNATTTAMSASYATNEQCRINATVASGISANQPTAIANNGDSGTRLITFNAEI